MMITQRRQEVMMPLQEQEGWGVERFLSPRRCDQPTPPGGEIDPCCSYP
jgi:hypothetical protein